jgi:hypothetical protein
MATYQTSFEKLGDRRFQLFAQSLLSYEYPDLQALPVGQPDGGRDALTRSKGGEELLIFQVKFVERPDNLKDVEKWVEEVIAKEQVNIDRLIRRGAQKYFLVTNVLGSSHLDVGAIDLGQKVLNSKISIPSQVLWRPDLEARLAKHRGLKWQYRELLSGQDVLEELITSGLSEDRQRRHDAIAASLGAQYLAERTVRFRQIELQNDLLDLFVDVPLAMGRVGNRIRATMSSTHELRWSEDGEPALVPVRGQGTQPRGAADIILRQPVARTVTRIVIEGAPGQGKSTLAQYLCQVHRMSLLAKRVDLQRLPAELCQFPTRLPFKVDLRELAIFFRHEDPFSNVTNWGGIPVDWPRSLVAFLAAQVRRYSGGADFNVSDLLAVARTGPVMLVLDGLDEVAEISDRKLIVDTVTEGLAALEEVAEDVQVVVTTRPPAFANSPGFPRQTFQYTTLTSLTTDLIVDYTKRWAAARRLQDDELSETLSILDAKLDEPHMRDLARNPMQLAILLSLINTKGDSLPDKRTQLYSAYMDLYFDREASKSPVVRERRDLLYGLHGYLAWKLHVGAERSAERGSISLEELEAVVGEYLEDQGADTALADELFQGVVERIIALVATRQERFEFEVQPLREFFAAHHLYSTAQVSQMGTARPGTRADRFGALARDAFWLNVARFFAGFYTSGELPSLADCLEALAEDADFALTDRPRGLAAMLLADWSFSLDLRSRERAIAVVLKDLGRRHAMESVDDILMLPRGSGREEVCNACLALIREGKLSSDRHQAMFRVLENHIEPSEFVSHWLELARASTGRDRTLWLRLASNTDVLGRIDEVEVESLMRSDGDESELGERTAIAVRGGAAGLVEESPVLSNALITRILSWPNRTWLGDMESSFLAAFNQVMLLGYGAMGPRRLREIMGPLNGGLGDELSKRAVPEHLEWCARVVELARDMRDARPSNAWVGWGQVIEILRSHDPETWAGLAISIGVVAASQRERRRTQESLVDETLPLLDRIRHSRARSGSSSGKWWTQQFEAASSEYQLRLVALCCALWVTGDALKSIIGRIGEVVEALDDAAFERFLDVVDMAAQAVPARKSGLTHTEIRNCKSRLAVVIHRLTSREEQSYIWTTRLERYRGGDPVVEGRCLVLSIGEVRAGDEWKRILARVRRSRSDMVGPTYLGRQLPRALAASVVEAPLSYPLWIIEAAEQSLTPQPVPTVVVGTVARRDKWFK